VTIAQSLKRPTSYPSCHYEWIGLRKMGWTD
jgi:hypothetical protein